MYIELDEKQKRNFKEKDRDWIYVILFGFLWGLGFFIAFVEDTAGFYLLITCILLVVEYHYVNSLKRGKRK